MAHNSKAQQKEKLTCQPDEAGHHRAEHLHPERQPAIRYPQIQVAPKRGSTHIKRGRRVTGVV
jgi:hypothetical protein